MAVTCGSSVMAAVDEDGRLWAWGDGQHGELGLGDHSGRPAPTLVPSNGQNVVMVSAGVGHMAALAGNGVPWVCGFGARGQLGLGGWTGRNRMTQLPRALFADAAVAMISCAGHHTIALTVGGRVWTFGDGADGQLGQGDRLSRNLPTLVAALDKIVYVVAGHWHSVAVGEEGNAFTWGQGKLGKLGHDNEDDHLLPQELDRGRFGGGKVVQVAAALGHTAAVTQAGSLWTWGAGPFCGDGMTPNKLVPALVNAEAFEGSAVLTVACGDGHTLVVTRDGAVWAWGFGSEGQLGQDDFTSHLRPRRVGAPELDCTRFVTAAAGRSHSAAVTHDGALWAWGKLSDGGAAVAAPTLVSPATFSGARIGLCRALPSEHALAFAMCTHDRLGGSDPSIRCTACNADDRPLQPSEAASAAGGSCVFAGLPDHLLRMVVDMSNSWPETTAALSEGAGRLLGGGEMWEDQVARRRAAFATFSEPRGQKSLGSSLDGPQTLSDPTGYLL